MNKIMLAKHLKAMSEEIESANFFQKLKTAFPVQEEQMGSDLTCAKKNSIAFCTTQEADQLLSKWSKNISEWYNQDAKVEEGEDGFLSSSFFTNTKDQVAFADQNGGYFPINTLEWHLSDKYVGILTSMDGEIYFYSFTSPEEFRAKMKTNLVDGEALKKIGKVSPEMVPEEYR